MTLALRHWIFLQLNSSFVPGVILPFRHFLSIPLYKAVKPLTFSSPKGDFW